MLTCIPIESVIVINSIFEDYITWMKNIVLFTGMSLGSILLFIFAFWLILNVIMSLIAEFFPFLRGIIKLRQFLLLPGSLMHMVWHVFAAKKLNMPMEQVYVFGFGWSRGSLKLSKRIDNLRQAIIFFWAPLMNILIIILLIMPGALLFQWLDTIINNTVFYWIWVYLLFSLIIEGLPDIADLVNPFHITIVKTPEFYLFIVFYIVLAPITLIFWGWGITMIFSLIYAITALYEVSYISKKEGQRLAKKFDKMFTETVTPVNPVVILTDDEYSD